MPPLRPARVAAAAPAGTAPAAAPAAEALVQAARLGGQVAFAVIDPATGALLEAREPDTALPPASVSKAVTALYALDALGANHRFLTRVMATGAVGGDGRVNGDLLLVGGGDPTLDTDRLADMVAQLRARGVRGISGRFLVHSASLPTIARLDPDQLEHVGYNPTISGLNLNFNRVYFEWTRAGGGWRVSLDARGERHRPVTSVAQMQVVDRAVPVYTYSDAGGIDRWTVAAQALGNGGSRWLPVRRPELYAGDVFRALCAAQGITLPAPATAGGGAVPGTVLVEHRSAPLATLLSDMMRWSTNLTAETVGLAASIARGGRPATLADSGAMMADWAAGRGLSVARLVDHSGLGDGSRVTARALAGYMAQAHRAGTLRGMMRPVTMRDAAGSPLRNPPVTAQGKTGTLNFVSALGGFLDARGGRTLAYAILTADMDVRARLRDDQRERPPGGRDWSARARNLQQALIERWAATYPA